MRCILSENNDPYFNLASEEYLLRSLNDEIFLLYRNLPSIVVGKHQNTLAQINLPFVKERGIVVARRISGGGTVFHDMGNLNFSFITQGNEGALVDYNRYTLPIIETLDEMGLKVSLGKRNELLIGDLKISGTASHVFKNRVLHHGTLLFSSEMKSLSSALNIQTERFTDRAVKSVPSEVTNIRDHLVEKLDMEEFQNRIYRHILHNMEGARPYQYSINDLKEINKLRNNKFSRWEWNYGYSPKYQFNKNLRFKSFEMVLKINVEKGVIQEINIESDLLGSQDIKALEDLLVGTIHDPETIRMRLSVIRVTDYISGLENEDFLSGMFD